MCVAIPGRVAEINGSTAKVDFNGNLVNVNIGLVEPKIDQYVLVHAGCAIEVDGGVSPSNAIGMNDGESYSSGDVTIHTIAASHEFLDRDESTGLYPYLQYIIEANGVRIHHAGDTVRYEGMLSKIRAFGSIDAQLLPINGRDAKRYRMDFIGNMTYQEAADLAGEVEPKIVIPGHWDMFDINGEDPSLFADYLDAKYGSKIKCIIPKVMEKIEIG